MQLQTPVQLQTCYDRAWTRTVWCCGNSKTPLPATCAWIEVASCTQVKCLVMAALTHPWCLFVLFCCFVFLLFHALLCWLHGQMFVWSMCVGVVARCLIAAPKPNNASPSPVHHQSPVHRHGRLRLLPLLLLLLLLMCRRIHLHRHCHHRCRPKRMWLWGSMVTARAKHDGGTSCTPGVSS